MNKFVLPLIEYSIKVSTLQVGLYLDKKQNYYPSLKKKMHVDNLGCLVFVGFHSEVKNSLRCINNTGLVYIKLLLSCSNWLYSFFICNIMMAYFFLLNIFLCNFNLDIETCVSKADFCCFFLWMFTVSAVLFGAYVHSC